MALKFYKMGLNILLICRTFGMPSIVFIFYVFDLCIEVLMISTDDKKLIIDNCSLIIL